MFYHIIVETKGTDKKNSKYFELDIQNKDDILKKFVIPYLEEKKITVNGYIIQPDEIRRFVIRQSEKTTKEIAQIRNDKIDRENRNGTVVILSIYTRTNASENEDYTTNVTDDFFEMAKNMANSSNHTISNLQNNKVFIVHGRDELLRTQVAHILQKLKLEPIILQEQVNTGQTIIEKIETHTNVGFAVVLYTPCDEGNLKGKSEEKKERARQNVVFEHGYLVAKLGRKNVCVLVSENVEFPSDISGLGYISAKDVSTWKYQLADELKAVGFPIDKNLL